jgi:preprotein translocase subunit SecA
MGLEERRRKVEGAEEIYFVHPDEPDKRVFAKRIDHADRVYKDLEAKDRAIADEIRQVQEIGRPVLVGTTSVEHSEQLHRMLSRMKVEHAVLNAKIHQSEALIVAQAGRKGAVTISTNMAGRGTDILLGGNPEGMAAEALEKEMFDTQELVQLAVRLLTDGEEKARELVQNNRKLTADLIPALQKTKAEFDEALTEIEQSQVIGYLALKFQEPYDIDYSDIRHVLRLVRGGRLAEAREHLDKIDKDVAMVDEAVRLWGMYTRYERMHADPRQAAQFIAETLFEKLYNSRAALIRASLSGDRAEAERLVKNIPGLEPHHLEKIEKLKSDSEKERQEIWELGGLHVVGSERHESRRIDNQLRGRAARQGDPGSSRFFLSVEDDLMRRFGGERLKGAMSRISMPDDMPIEAGILDRIIESSQERIEGYNFDLRKNVVEYDDVMSKQREAIYGERRAILLSESFDLDAKINESFETSIDELIQNFIDDYKSYMRGEVDRAVADYSTDATDAINVNGILVRMRGLLPGVVELDRSELADASADKITRDLMILAQENLEEGRHLYQFLQAAGRFIPLLPPIPNLGALLSGRRSGHLQARENLHLQFVEQIEKVFQDFLAHHLDENEREKIWKRTVEQIDAAFSQFNVEGLSNKAIQSQQASFFLWVDETLRKLLLDSLSTLKSEQLSEALNDYVSQQAEQWKEQIGQEEYENFQRLVLLDAIDREWRDYLIAMDDLRREIGLEAIAQRDPKVEYKRRSFQMFAEMRHNIEKNVVDSYFRRLASHQDFIHRREESIAYQERMSQAGYQVVQREKGKGVELRRDMPKVGRNDLCPCGSGKKYKNCHMRKDQATTTKGSRRVRSR